MGEKAHLRTMAALLANATATTLVYPSVQGPARARRPCEPAGRRRPADRRPPGPACGPHCSSSICFTGTVLTTCLPRVCFIATAVRRSHSSCYYYYYSIISTCGLGLGRSVFALFNITKHITVFTMLHSFAITFSTETALFIQKLSASVIAKENM